MPRRNVAHLRVRLLCLRCPIRGAAEDDRRLAHGLPVVRSTRPAQAVHQCWRGLQGQRLLPQRLAGLQQVEVGFEQHDQDGRLGLDVVLGLVGFDRGLIVDVVGPEHPGQHPREHPCSVKGAVHHLTCGQPFDAGARVDLASLRAGHADSSHVHPVPSTAPTPRGRDHRRSGSPRRVDEPAIGPRNPCRLCTAGLRPATR